MVTITIDTSETDRSGAITSRYMSRLTTITPTIESSAAAQKGNPHEEMNE